MLQNNSGTAMMDQHLSLAPSGTRASPATVSYLGDVECCKYCCLFYTLFIGTMVIGAL